MTQDEIIRMAREADIPCFAGMYVVTELSELERFAALVAAHEREKHNSPSWETVDDAIAAEREACAKMCDETKAPKIRDEWSAGQTTGCSSCAAAIRARGEK